MNTELKTKLEAILDECLSIVELSEKATPGPWHTESKTACALIVAIEAIHECSHFWQAAQMKFGPDHPLKDAETRALKARDEAFQSIVNQWEGK